MSIEDRQADDITQINTANDNCGRKQWCQTYCHTFLLKVAILQCRHTEDAVYSITRNTEKYSITYYQQNALKY